MGIRLVVIDDNPHLTWDGAIYPANATFHRFLSAVLDVPGAPVASIVHCVPLGAADRAPRTLPLDRRLEVVGTSPFDGIGGYLRHAPTLIRRNANVLRPVISSADLVWIKVPASNALLAGYLALRAGVPHFGYVAGSAFAVAHARRLGLPAQAVGLVYDLAGRVAGGRQRIVVGEGLVDGGGIVTSLVEDHEIRNVIDAPWPADPSRLRLAWAGRLAPGKGLEQLFDAAAILATGWASGPRIELIILGDGPARPALEARATRLGIADRIQWHGYVADRAAYMAALGSGDIFVFPSHAEGFPKVILDAMAVGLPVVATPAGRIEPLVRFGLLEPAPATPDRLAATIVSVAESEAHARRLQAAGHDFSAKHTRQAEASRLVRIFSKRRA